MIDRRSSDVSFEASHQSLLVIAKAASCHFKAESVYTAARLEFTRYPCSLLLDLKFYWWALDSIRNVLGAGKFHFLSVNAPLAFSWPLLFTCAFPGLPLART